MDGSISVADLSKAHTPVVGPVILDVRRTADFTDADAIISGAI
jgi:hypothetical protein